MAFGNKNLSRAYSDIIYGNSKGTALMGGIDFNIINPSSQEKILGISIFFEGGRNVVSAHFQDFLWQNYKYDIYEAPILTAFRFGGSLVFPMTLKSRKS
jgi:hypothetical protein